jgi:hypothetical protein
VEAFDDRSGAVVAAAEIELKVVTPTTGGWLGVRERYCLIERVQTAGFTAAVLVSSVS